MKNLFARRFPLLVLALLLALASSGIAYALSTHELSLTKLSTFHRSFDLWVVTTESEFNEGVLNNVDTSSSPGDVKLAIPDDWYDASWSRRAPVTISNSGSALTDYQVKVDVTYDADMQSNFDDIRFTAGDGTTLLSYWRESYSASTSAVFWVKVSSIPAGDSTIYMYYGNSGASSTSNGTNTFDFFDDFDDASLGADWTFSQIGGASGSYTESGTVIRLSGTDTGDLWGSSDRFLFLNISGNYDNVLIESYTSAWGGTHGVWSKMGGVQLSQSVDSNSKNRIMSPVYSAEGATNSYRVGTGGITDEQTTATTPNYNRVSRVGGTSRAWYSTDGITWTELGSQISFTGGLADPVCLGIHLAGISSSPHWVDVDWFRVRKYADPEPTTVVGTEEAIYDAWYDASWSRRAPVTISNSGSALTDYQVEVDVTYDADMQSNFDDIRFTAGDGTTLLSYWRESYSVSTSAVFWVKVSSVPAGDSTIYIYYGNAGVSSTSNGTNTFVFFDDMEAWSGWADYGSGSVTQDSTRAYDGTYSAHKTDNNDPNGAYKPIGTTLGRDIIVEAWFNRNSGYSGGPADKIGVIDDSGNGYGSSYAHSDAVEKVAIDRRDSYARTTLTSSSSLTDIEDTWYKLKLIIEDDVAGTLTASRIKLDGTEEGIITATDSTYSSFTRVYIFGGHDYWVDQMIIRKYADPDPTASVGAEEAICGWYDASWSRRAPVTISNSGSALTHYQVEVDVTYDADMQSNFDDIRFTAGDGTTLLSYWRESYSVSTSAVFWVKVSSIPAGDSTIYMYYGNAAASSASDGDATFVFFDDFLGTSLDGTKWNLWDATVSVSSSVVTITNTGAWGNVISQTEYSMPYRFVGRAQKTTTIGSGQVGLKKWYVTTGDQTLNIFDVPVGLPQVYHTTKWDGTQEWDVVGTWTLSTWYHYEIKGKSDEVKYYRDGVLQYTETTLTAIPVGTMSVLFSSAAVNDQLLVDYCFICKYASPEPITVVGAEEGLYSSPGTIASNVYDTSEVNAGWDLLGWDKTLPSGTDITFEVRASDAIFLKDDATPAWQDASVLPTGRYQQWRATLTSNSLGTPILHEVWDLYSW